MIGGLGIWELLLILFIVLIIFGAGKLPEIGAGLGKGIGNFKKATQEGKELDVTPKDKKAEGGAAEKSKTNSDQTSV
ncbi:MAG: twin-arginine translocase TatA/TatE family subunit [Pseudomonadota bacterium]